MHTFSVSVGENCDTSSHHLQLLIRFGDLGLDTVSSAVGCPTGTVRVP